MKKYVRKKQYKARKPEETVRIIKDILEECGIRTEADERVYEKPDVASCRVRICGDNLDFGDFGTNGKGMNRSYSLASAYGELMERLQNFILFGDYTEDAYRKGMTGHMSAPDEKMLTGNEAGIDSARVLSELMRIPEGYITEGSPENEKTAFVPYYDVYNDRQVMLPHKTLRMVTGSNGMAAGNTYMEAVTQGMAEIYERAAVMEAYRDNPVIKQLRPESFAGNAVHDRLEGLKKYGYDYRILDLSMDKNYPVVGLLLIKGNLKAFRAGADPCPVTALERCLTEIFQGDEYSVNDFFKSQCCKPFKDNLSVEEKYAINDQEIAYHVDGSGMTASCLFNPSDEFNENFRGTDGESEEADYEYMVKLTKSLGLQLYIRDWSFLGFPSYHIIIPELSNYDLIYEDGRDIYRWSFEEIRFRNDRLTKSCAEILNRMFEIYERNIPSQDKTMMGR